MKKIFEYNDFNELSEQELMEMANVDYETTGIKDVVIWIGPNPKSHGKRIKISNIPNKFDGSKCFTLTIPDFKIIGNVNTKLITTDVLNKIKQFITDNYQLISDFSDYLISTKKLIDNLKKVE